MGGPIVIPKNPRSVVRRKISEVEVPSIPEEHRALFNEVMMKEQWTPGENSFMQSHLAPEDRTDDWCED